MKIRNYIFLILFFLAGFASGILASDQVRIGAERLMEDFFSPDSGQGQEIKTEEPKEKEFRVIKDFSSFKTDLLGQNVPSLIEVNFPEMKVRAYENGEMKKEADISAKGDSEEWGGTAAGLYKVIYKNQLAYSGIAEVNMPYAINFYGKFFIHGIPYYGNGEKRITDVTGGCVQLSDRDAKDIFNLAGRNAPVVVIDRNNDGYSGYRQDKETTGFPSVSAKSYLVADLDSGTVLAEKNPEEKHPAASLIKLMTATVVAENIDLRKSIYIDQSMLNAYGSTNGLIAGNSYNLIDLLHPLLIESSNDAAEALSGFLGRTRTIRSMNEKARSLGMENTVFVDPHGYDPANVSTPTDLFYLSRYILNNRSPLLKISKGEQVSTYGDGVFRELDNKNLFFNDQNFIGGKTGYITQSGYNGIFLMKFNRNGEERRVAIIMLGSENLLYGEKSLKVETQKIIDWINDNFFSQDQVIV